MIKQLLTIGPDFEVDICPELTQIDQFNKLITLYTKEKTLKFLTYISLYTDPSVANKYYTLQEDIRSLKLQEDLKITINNDVVAALIKWQELIYSVEQEYYDSAIHAVKNIMEYFYAVDFTKETKGGAAKYKPKEVLDAITASKAALKTLEETREKLKSGLSSQQTVARGGRVINASEDPTDINKEPLDL